MLTIGRDLTQALRSLFKDRTFTFVCVISLGIGMGAFVALVTFTRMITSPARGIDITWLTELLVLPTGPLRARSGTWALERWSSPDYRALRESDTGMSITGWVREFSDLGERPADGTAPPRVPAKSMPSTTNVSDARPSSGPPGDARSAFADGATDPR